VAGSVLDALLIQAEAELPNECCGFLAGTRRGDIARATERFPLVNAAASPTRYEADPRDLLRAFRTMRERGLEHLAIYHSHPTSAPVPSRTDLARAFYPEVVYLIVSMLERPPHMRGWWLTETDFREAAWERVDCESE
jgi:proteasome lid subunit RPN8/RPN11